MSEMKHTPGPWVVTGISMDTGSISVGAKLERIVIADVTNAASFGDMLSGAMRRRGGGFSQDDCTTQHANARLIAAAPDLLAACLEVHKCGNGGAKLSRTASDMVRAAIAKATQP